MDVVTSIANVVHNQLAAALIYLLLVAAVDLVLGILVAGVLTKNFSLRKLGDFTITTLGFQKTVAFVLALLLMVLHGNSFTEAAVAAMAILYATSILPDVYDKLSTLLFGGKLPLSTNLRPVGPIPASTAPALP